MSRLEWWTGRILFVCLALGPGWVGHGYGQAVPEAIGPAPSVAETARALSNFIEAERDRQGLPAVLIVLVDDQQIVWARGFGVANPTTKAAATAGTIGRVGSVSKLFTDLAAMRLVEQGKLDLDAPVSRYLPDFQPDNRSGQEITLRHLMSHRAGLVREPAVGHYFDLAGPSLAETVRSLNGVGLVHPPGTRTKYSNAGIAVVGRVVEAVSGQPFSQFVQQAVLGPCGMADSGFEPTDAMRARCARGIMWTEDGRTFDAPSFRLGMLSAGDLYATPIDLGRFLAMLNARGQGSAGRVVSNETLEAMWKVQFGAPDAQAGFGLGFAVSPFEGTRRVGHSGAVYGFATDLQALPDEKLGVAVIVTRDCANGIANRIAEEALRRMRAEKRGDGQPIEPVATTSAIDPGQAAAAAGNYRDDRGTVELIGREGRLFLRTPQAGMLMEVRALGDGWVVDCPQSYGLPLKWSDQKLELGGRRLARLPDAGPPPAAPERFLPLIGEYGFDHNILYILEQDGVLHAQIEWFFNYPLEEIGPDHFRFPDFGMYDNQEVRFERDAHGKVTGVRAAEVFFPRRVLDGENGQTFRVKPACDVNEARQAAEAARPPVETTPRPAAPDLVELTRVDPSVRLDIRYATTSNFLGTPLYRSARAFLQRPAAEAVRRANQRLEPLGLGLLVHDGYRPWTITKLFRLATPPEFHHFVADPDQGSRHNRGCAVDLTLCDRATGQPIAMPGGYDEFSTRSYPNYPGGTARQRWYRDLLRRTMEAEGFQVYQFEWWHFDFKDWPRYPIGNQSFDELAP